MIRPQNMTSTRWKVLWESTNPRESVFVANTWQHLPHLLFCGPLVSNFPTELFCKQSPVYGVFHRYFHIPLPIVTKHELGLPFPPRNLSHKIWCKSVHNFLVMVVTDRHTDTHRDKNQSRWKHTTRFRGDNTLYRPHRWTWPTWRTTTLEFWKGWLSLLFFLAESTYAMSLV